MSKDLCYRYNQLEFEIFLLYLGVMSRVMS